ncbi:MAG: hypothetical protein HWN67_10280, partial [Candidatus Helarchaeota archaeon]|nr:hypothetical protein [Candidatus Helarchaeota archaeon]
MDADDNLWLFGGSGYNSTGSFGRLNDLWMFNMTSRWWTWVSGNDTINQAGTYGTKGVPAAGNVPGARRGSISWIDSNDTLWLFGGYGFDSAGSFGYLNDLWMFNMTSGWWTWVSGNDTRDQAGTYGTKGLPAAGNVPGARFDSVSSMDSDDNRWLFGGYGYDSADDFGRLNDLWMFNMTSRWWTWVSGNDTRNQAGTYGTKGV